jgi:hypothetical protein
MEKRTQGMNWIRKEKRLAIYLRDGVSCAYCGKGVEDGATLSLDHLTPYSKGGSNQETNLVTCCQSCNSARQAKSWKEFANSDQVVKHINKIRRRKLDKYLTEAKAIMSRRNSWAAVVEKNFK